MAKILPPIPQNIFFLFKFIKCIYELSKKQVAWASTEADVRISSFSFNLDHPIKTKNSDDSTEQSKISAPNMLMNSEPLQMWYGSMIESCKASRLCTKHIQFEV